MNFCLSLAEYEDDAKPSAVHGAQAVADGDGGDDAVDGGVAVVVDGGGDADSDEEDSDVSLIVEFVHQQRNSDVDVGAAAN